MTQKIQICKNTIEQPATRHRLEIISESIQLIEQYTETFLSTDDIVDAQFYYSNPLLYLIINDVKDQRCLYGNLYLLNVEDWEFLTHEPIFAINQVFAEKIDTIKYSFVLDPQHMIELHQTHGLYLIGIKNENCT